MGVVAAGWMVLGMFPVLLRHPLVGASLVGSRRRRDVARVGGRRRDRDGAERRFEADTLRSLMPYVAAYFLVIVFLPLATSTDAWHFELGLTGAGNNVDQQQLRLLEPVASLTMLGYSWPKRADDANNRSRAMLVRVAPECALVALAMEASRGFQPGTGASAITLVADGRRCRARSGDLPQPARPRALDCSRTAHESREDLVLPAAANGALPFRAPD